MMRILLSLIIYFSFTSLVHAECLKVPTKDFSSAEKKEISSKKYSNLGILNNKCWYFRDVVFKNGHGQQAVVVADQKGKCLGFFRTSLADSAELHDAMLSVKSADGDIFKADLSSGIPKSLFYDGDISPFEECIN